MTRVFERLYLGSADDAEQLASANPLRITTVVNVGSRKTQAKRDGLLYIHIPLVDEKPVPPAVLKRVLSAIADNICKGKVLVHCVAGASRSPAMVAAYMHHIGYKSFDAAVYELQELRSAVDPSRIIRDSVRKLLSA